MSNPAQDLTAQPWYNDNAKPVIYRVTHGGAPYWHCCHPARRLLGDGGISAPSPAAAYERWLDLRRATRVFARMSLTPGEAPFVPGWHADHFHGFPELKGEGIEVEIIAVSDKALPPLRNRTT